MTPRVAVAAVTLLVAASVAISQRGTRDHAQLEPAGPAVVSAPATPASAPAPSPSPLRVARRALRWQLAAEAGQDRPIPARTFTPALARLLTTRPPVTSPVPGRSKVVSLREQTRVAGARRVLVTVRRGTVVEHITLLVVCRPGCLIASVE